MPKILSLILFLQLLFGSAILQKRMREKGESDYPFLVNMWIPKNSDIKQERSRFCDAIQLTPFTDYFFTTAKCFDNLEHDMWLEDIGISWDENVVTYSRHMSFLTRYKEEGGNFVILERFERNPLEMRSPRYDDVETTITTKHQGADIEELTKGTPEPQEIDASRKEEKKLKVTKSNVSQINIPKNGTGNITENLTENLDEEYEEIPADLSQYEDLESSYEIKGQVTDEEDMKILRSFRKKRVKLSSPDVRGATDCYVLGWSTFLREYRDIKDLEGLILKKEMVSKLPRRLCRSPNPAHVCVIKDTDDRECVEDLGSPLICEKKDDKNNTMGVALVGIYTGYRNCVTTDMGFFRSLSADLPWIARWAKGTPIMTTGFMRRRKESIKAKPAGKTRSRWRLRARTGISGVEKISVNCIVFVMSYISYIFIAFICQ